jgi:hypothetical protein
MPARCGSVEAVRKSCVPTQARQPFIAAQQTIALIKHDCSGELAKPAGSSTLVRGASSNKSIFHCPQ